ncbi:unnamed protein product [Allacma fusca]|uniref:Unconventional myosin-XVIIIa n=1 Tax=Allacma fusca TaxID=39272 RepID=A0A8J2LEH5_9HEXA|nr:unnamed protein product [Allacma fusca]
MFQFMRKSEKDREKEKKPGKPEKPDKGSLGKKVKDKLSPEDLHRLDEIRRSFKLGKGKKDKPKLPSGIIADYSENFMSPLLTVTSPLKSPDSGSGEGDGFPPISHSDSSESSLSSTSVSLKEPAPGPDFATKPPRAPVTARKTPPPIPSRKPPSSIRYSSDVGTSEIQLGAGLSRPPTSASSSSFTPSYITPPQSPSHKSLNLSKFYCVPELDLSEKVLPHIITKRGLLRTLLVERQPSGDFGFSLRRASLTLKDGFQETILYAEPSHSKINGVSDVFLLPGDRLVTVNGVSVENKGRDEVINLIRSSQYSVTLQVQTNPLWVENIHRVRYQKEEDKTDGTTSRRGVWIVHKNGFVSGHVLEKVEDTGKCKVKLDTGQIYEVDEDDIENTNPESLDNISQLWNLNLINESSILHILRNRFHSSLPFTLSTYRNVLYLTRNAKLDTENYKFLRQVTQPFSSSKLHPNIYSLVLQSYRALVTSKRNQSIIIHGEAGNVTKRECAREILRYLSEGKGPHIDSKFSSVPNPNTNNPTGTFWDRLQAVEDLIHFFCSSDSNHVKGSKLYNLEFDLGGRLVGINAQIFTLDLERMYDGPYFTVLQALHDLSISAIDVLGPFPYLKQLRKDLLLEEADTGAPVKQSTPFFSSEISRSGAIEENLQKIGKISEAMLLLGLGETFTKSVWSVFGAVYHLGHVVGTLSNALNSHIKESGAGQMKHAEGGERHFKNACALLGLPTERVEKSLVSEETEVARLRNVMGFAIGLYFESINTVFTTVNKNNSVGFRNIQCLSINVVEIGHSSATPGRFGDLAVNYINERLARLMKDINFDRLTRIYKSEGLETESATTPVSPTGKDVLTVTNGHLKDGSDLTNYYDVLPLLDSFPANTTSTNAHQKKGKGLLFLIDEAKEPVRFLEKFETEFFGENEFRNLYWVDFRNTTISLCHSNGTRIVEYDVKKVLSHADVVSASKFTNLLLQESQKDNINCMFLKSSSPIIGLCMSSNASEISLRRASSIRRNYATTWKKKNASLNIKIQADYLIEILERTQVQMLHCLNPSESPASVDLDIANLRNQIRSVNLPDTIRFFKGGYPRYMLHQEFARKFKCLGSPGLADEGLGIRDRVLDVFNKQDVPSNSYQLGNTMVFMKQWLMEELEQKRDDKLESKIMAFQSFCRGFLARRHLEKMKVKDIAVRCVQKNVRKLLAVRNWTWWKLYQQISPLLKVQSSHEKLHSALDELASLKIRFEKADSEKNRLKSENERLEIKCKMSSYLRGVDPMFSRSPSSPIRTSRPSSSVSLSSGKWKPKLPPVRSHVRDSLSTFGNRALSSLPVRKKLVQYPQDGVVIRAGFSILPPGISKTTFRTKYEPSPAHKDPQTDSARLTVQIQDFLKRSDHIEQQWSQMTGKKHYPKARDKVKTSIAIRGFQMSHSSSLATMEDVDSSFVLQHSETMSLLDVANPFDEMDESEVDLVKDSQDPAVWDCSELESFDLEPESFQDNDPKKEPNSIQPKVNELTAELSEEQTTSAMTSEKLDAETNEKQKLENQLSQIKSHCQSIENEKHQLELDLAYSMSEVNGDTNLDDYNEDSLYKQRWERANRELEIQKQRLKQREQDHLDQIMVLKKSLEKKCSDAWEEAEEQRQVVAQLKRRIQKLSSELSDVRCLLQEETSRSSLLEKKQRRVDTEISSINTQLEKERLNKERACRERDAALIQSDSLNNELQSVKMDLQMKESKLASLEAELEESSRFSGSNEQLNALRKARTDLLMKVKEQEEELDDLAGQVQTLEAAKLRLEMQFEQVKKEHKREIQQREDELEDVRSSAHKKVKALECQLEAEHEERTAILRAKQEFERKFYDLEELSSQRSVSQEQVTRLKRELKRTRALLKDAQTIVEQSKNDSMNKGMLRQLRHQLEDSESQKARLNRAKQKLEEELSDALLQLEDMTKNRNESENVKNVLLREKSQMQMQFEEYEEQLSEVMRKYKASVDQLSLEQNALSEQSMQISELESANSSLKETIAELNAKLESLEEDQASQQIQKRFHMKIRELETRMELETTTKGRLEGQVARLKEHIEKLHEDVKAAQTREYLVIDKYKKVERQLRDSKEEINRNSQKDTEAQSRRIMLEKQLDSADLEISTLKNDLKLAMQRIEDLTAAIKECDEVSEDDEDEDSSTESVTSDTEITESLPHTHISLDFDCKNKKQRSIADSYS